MSEESEILDNDPETESDRSMDKEVLQIQRALRIVKTLTPAAKTYVFERLKTEKV